MNKILSSYYNRVIKEYDDIIMLSIGNKSYNSITYSLFIHRDAVYVKAN